LIVVLLIVMVVLWEIGRFFRYIGNSTQSYYHLTLCLIVFFSILLQPSGDKKLVASGERVSPWIMCHGIILRYPRGYRTSKLVTCYNRSRKYHINGIIITFDGTNITYNSTFITLFSTFIHFTYNSTFITIMVPGTNIIYDGTLHHI
jgi:hypothetical protein